MIEGIIVAVIVGVGAVLVGRSLYKTFSNGKSEGGGCGCCSGGGCGPEEEKKEPPKAEMRAIRSPSATRRRAQEAKESLPSCCSHGMDH